MGIDARKFISLLVGSILVLSFLLHGSVSAEALKSKVSLKHESEFTDSEYEEVSAEILAGARELGQTVIQEITELRTSNSKHYRLSDGTNIVEISSGNQNYLDEKGIWQSINTTLIDEADLEYFKKPLSKESATEIRKIAEQNKISRLTQHINPDITNYRALQVPFDVKLPKKINNGYSVKHGNNMLTFIPVNSNSVVGSVYQNTIFYQAVWEDTDVKITVTNDGVKEELMLLSANAPSQFSFEVKGNITQSLSAGTLFLQPAWVEDSNGVRRDVEQILRQENGRNFLDLVVNSDGLQYPLLLDPTVFVASQSEHTHVSGYLPKGPEYLLSLKSTNPYLSQVLIRFDVSSIPSNAIVQSAKLNLYRSYSWNPYNPSLSTNVTMSRVTSTWNEYQVTFSSMPSISGIISETLISQGLFWNDPIKLSEFEMTSAVKNWVDGSWSNYGVHLNGCGENDGCVFFSKFTAPSSDYVPKLTVNYEQKPIAPTIISPNGGEVVDAIHNVTWSAASDPDTVQSQLKYHVQLSQNGGADWTDILALSAAGQTQIAYDFTSKPAGNNYLVRVRAYDGVQYGPWDQSNATFTIKHNQPPGAPSNTSPGGTTSGTAVTVPGTAIPVSWTFNDPDAGDVQSAYQVAVYLTSNALVSNTNWITSSLQSHTLSSGLTRGTTYYWNVKTKDVQGAISPVSANRFIKINRLPVAAFSSYSDNQTLPDNQLTFTWTYSDLDSHVQTKYQVQGSKDNWATIAYNSGEVASSATSLTANFAQGVWNFRVRVFDGYEWSNWSNRNNLTLPNSFEPNDTFATAFPAQYGQNYTTLLNTSADIDFFKWTALKTGIDRISLNVPSAKNYDVYVYDSNQVLLASGIRGINQSEEQYVYVQTGQTYYVKVFAPTGDFSSSPYTLNINRLGAVSGDYQTIYEYDDNGNLVKKQTVSP